MTHDRSTRKTADVDRRGFLTAGAGASAALLAGSIAVGADKRAGPSAGQLREHARRLHRESVVVVIHDHNPVGPDIPLMLAGGVTAKVFQIGIDVDVGPDSLRSASIREGWSSRAMAALDEVDRLVAAQPDRVVIAKTAQDVRRAKRDGKIAIILGVEGAKLLDGRVEMVQKFYDRGLRELQLRWGVPNQIVEEEILTPFGRQVVKECNRLGIIVGLTHIPHRAFFQVIEMTKDPPLVCHGVAIRQTDGGWDLDDRQLKALAAMRGMIGLNFYSSCLGRKPTIKKVIQQVDYIANLVGIDTVGLGIDLFPTTGKWRQFQHLQGEKEIAWAIPDLSHLPEVTEALVARNYSDADIKKVLGENFLRVAKEVFGA